MKALTIALALLTIAAMASTAMAQDRPARRAARNTDMTEHTFTDADQVVGETVGADGEHLRVRRGRFVGSLIRPRTHFVDALTTSVEKL